MSKICLSGKCFYPSLTYWSSLKENKWIKDVKYSSKINRNESIFYHILWWLSFTVQSSFLILVKFYFSTSNRFPNTKLRYIANLQNTRHLKKWVQIVFPAPFWLMYESRFRCFSSQASSISMMYWVNQRHPETAFISAQFHFGISIVSQWSLQLLQFMIIHRCKTNRLTIFVKPSVPPPSTLCHRTDSHSELVQKQHCWNWYPVSITLLSAPALKWN